MRRISLAIVCSLAMTGFVLADEFTVAITKIDGNSVTYFKMGPAGEKGYLAKALRKTGDAITTAMSANVKVQRRITVDFETRKFGAEDLEDGLNNNAFKFIPDPGLIAFITVADDGTEKGKITAIVVTGISGPRKKN